MAELGDGPLRGRLARSAAAAAAGPRPSPWSTPRTSAGPGSPSARPGRARASSPDGPARRAGPPGRRARRWRRRTASCGSVLAAPAVRTRSTGSGAAREPRERRPRPRHRVVLDVVDGDDRRAEPLDLGPDAGLEPLARGRAHGLLDDDPDPRRDERRDPDDRVRCRSRSGARRSSTIARLDDVRRDLDARDEVAALDDLAVEDREHLERVEPVEPLELGDPDVDDAVAPPRRGRPGSGSGRGRRGPARRPLGRAAGRRRPRGARRARRSRTVTGGPASAAASASRSSAVSRRPFAQRLPADRQVAGEDGARQARGRAPTGSDPLDPHAVPPPGRSGGAAERGLDRAAGVDDGHLRPVRRDPRGCRC